MLTGGEFVALQQREADMDTVDFDALEGKTRALLSPASWAFLETGADDEITAVENVTDWRAMRLRPRMMTDLGNVNTEITALGQKVSTPIFIAPAGRHKLFHPEAERATAIGASEADVLYVYAHAANVPYDEIAAQRKNAPQWFQLYLHRDHKHIEAMLDDLAVKGYTAVVLTVDSQMFGWSPSAARQPFTPTPEIRNVNFPGQPIARHGYDPAFQGVVQFPSTWKDLDWLVKRSPLPIVVKGVMRGDDAKRSIDCGAKGVVVSNHGGRHIDTTVTTAAVLPEVVAAVKGQGEVYVDGGIRRGTDIVKAIALGARAVLIGRPAMWGLTVNGAQGVADVMKHLRNEFLRNMQLCGASSVDQLTPDMVVLPPTMRRV